MVIYHWIVCGHSSERCPQALNIPNTMLRMKKIQGAFKSFIAMALDGLSRSAKYFAAPVGSKKQSKVPIFTDLESQPVTNFSLVDSCQKHLGGGRFHLDPATLEKTFLHKLREEDLEETLLLEETIPSESSLKIQLAIEADEIPPEGMGFIRDFFYRDHD